MFEKEAEEYATRECCMTCNNINHFCKEKCECWTFAKKGAEFGYNKANEWLYPSKGEYPKECENVLCYCYCKGTEIKFCCVGHTVVGGDNKIRWWSNNKTEELRVIAWKEITLPELPKEIKEKCLD